MIDFNQFLEEGIVSQQKYAEKGGRQGSLDLLSDEERYKYVIEHLGHMAEEVVETRMCVPRRSWKKNEVGYLESRELRDNFCHELTDILLFFRAVLAYSGISVTEFEKCFNDKLDYNKVRKDHK